MLEKSFRPSFQRLFVKPIAKKLPVNPSLITIAGAFIGLGILPALYFHMNLLALIFLGLSGYCDALDGTVARHFNKSTKWGTALDIVSDRLVEFAVIFALFLVAPLSRASLSLLMLGSVLLCITSFLVVGIFTENQTHKGFHYSIGLIERAEAFIFFGTMIIFPQWFALLAILFTSLVFLTAILHLFHFYFFLVSAKLK